MIVNKLNDNKILHSNHTKMQTVTQEIIHDKINNNNNKMW